MQRCYQGSSGQILCTYSGPINFVDSNWAEIFAIRMGCCELQKIEGYNAMIKKDFFLAILWGSWRCTYPWKFADWVEEIHQISSHLGCSFYHILREANAIADCLAREGALN